jgi:hypothetical protein
MTRRKRYSEKFKRLALKRADKPGVTDIFVCEELGISLRVSSSRDTTAITHRLYHRAWLQNNCAE